jgi:NAD(P)-dependent dehydrogenase (short-subunit alcohol dehydrogenase family)
VAEALQESTGNPAIRVARLNLSDLRSVHAFARAWDGLSDILTNNAGIMAVAQREENTQGYEPQLATNFIGHFARSDSLASFVFGRPAQGPFPSLGALRQRSSPRRTSSGIGASR